jgi:hypothetical protein
MQHTFETLRSELDMSISGRRTRELPECYYYLGKTLIKNLDLSCTKDPEGFMTGVASAAWLAHEP